MCLLNVKPRNVEKLEDGRWCERRQIIIRFLVVIDIMSILGETNIFQPFSMIVGYEITHLFECRDSPYAMHPWVQKCFPSRILEERSEVISSIHTENRGGFTILSSPHIMHERTSDLEAHESHDCWMSEEYWSVVLIPLRGSSKSNALQFHCSTFMILPHWFFLPTRIDSAGIIFNVHRYWSLIPRRHFHQISKAYADSVIIVRTWLFRYSQAVCWSVRTHFRWKVLLIYRYPIVLWFHHDYSIAMQFPPVPFSECIFNHECRCERTQIVEIDENCDNSLSTQIVWSTSFQSISTKSQLCRELYNGEQTWLSTANTVLFASFR